MDKIIIAERAAQTVKDYIRRAKLLLAQAQRERYPNLDVHHIGTEISPAEFVEWLAGRRPQITANTWRQNKANVVCFFEQFQDDPVYVAALGELLKLGSTGCRPCKHGKTSSRKAKFVSEEDAERLLKALRSAPGEWGRRAALLFEATLKAGLRPAEWESAKAAATGLLVKNAKATNGRANGEYRAVPLEPSDLEICRHNIAEIQQWMEATGGRYSTYIAVVRNAIQRTTRRIFKRVAKPGKGIAIYSARHQFGANMKNIYGPAGVAALMGHRSEKTAKWHYARKGRGWAKFKATRRTLAKPLPPPNAPE